MADCWISFAQLISPLGTTAEAHLEALRAGRSGISAVAGAGFNQETWPQAKINTLPEEKRYDALLQQSVTQLQAKLGKDFFSNPRTLIIVSTTKADIQALPGDTFASTKRIIAETLQPAHKPLIISNACISGVLGINTAADFVQHGDYDTIAVIGIDILSDFVTYGFQSLFALSDDVTKPFDSARKGINLGEACGTVIVSNERIGEAFHAQYLGGSSSNDANHISGPSRTGEGLFRSVEKTLERSGVDRKAISFISAHGTGTLYNDEMESIAFNRLGLTQTPVNSLKGYFGHTLGAAGIIETIVCLFSLEHNELYASAGFENDGTSGGITLLKAHQPKQVNLVLKTASGFGGGNASILLRKP